MTQTSPSPRILCPTIRPRPHRPATARRAPDRRPAPGRSSGPIRSAMCAVTCAPLVEPHPIERARQLLDDDPDDRPSPRPPRYARAGTGTSRAVRIHGSPAVTATVCSKCADRLPSRVTAVQPSASTFTAGLPGVHHRLDREHHALGQPRPAARLAVVRHLRLLVHLLADAVPDELAHHREPVRLDVLLHGVADVRHPRRPAAPARSPCTATPRSPAAASPPPPTPGRPAA